MAGDHPETLSELQTPCLVIDIDTVKRNAQSMRERSERLGLKLRPHMKTHKTLEAGEILTGGTKRCIVVSTVKEAEFFADGGYEDILYAYPFSVDKLPRMKLLAERLELFHVLVDSQHSVNLLKQTPIDGTKKWSVFLKIDCGYKRAGTPWDSPDTIKLAKDIVDSENLILYGIYVHDGNAYDVKGTDRIEAVWNDTVDKLSQVAECLESEGINCAAVATGSTVSCSKPGKVIGRVNEIHPGNYVFYDVEQCITGACTPKDVAARVMTRVIGHYPHRNQMLVDCGFMGLSHDGKGSLPSGSCCMIHKHPELNLTKMTQEIGIIDSVNGKRLDFDRFPIGSSLFLLPYHSCATAAMHPLYYICSGDKVIDIWTPCKGW